ncbi:SDR family NAD(P)-dependent oxidoreductase [Parvularcula sp. IMCC14364]|uniref:SDR family NAD(P)-dependent oxidoreductase n=1 Tax=Parvularcula sp. IMCC14364 TaxID=3067902 RepID=UPI0027424F6E|nr:SDR family NAD(P)-dependent oxidoreductase [Parvularcula sp. IMCC14364]
MESLRDKFTAIVIGASGGIGSAACAELKKNPRCGTLVALSRESAPALDLTDSASIADAAAQVKKNHGTADLVFVASGILAPAGKGPEKSIRHLDMADMSEVFAINALGPALVARHFAPLLPRDSKSVLAFLSARVGSISDNRLGGWISYRAAKAALNQIVRTTAIDVARSRPSSVCLALHPGTVDTALSSDFTTAYEKFTPAESARQLLQVMDQKSPSQSGGFFAYDGEKIEW